jgi:membrane fusion protein, heavy metal efflux system
MKYIVFASFIFLFSCKTKKEDKATVAVEKPQAASFDLDDAQLKLMGIELGTAEQRALQGSIIATGKVTILANDMADISAQFKGRVERIVAHEGQYVKKGELLMELTSPDLIMVQKDYLLAQAELFYLEKELERQQLMAKENVGAAKSLQEVQSKVMMQKVILKTTATTLKLADIAPPQYEGLIVDKIQIRAPLAGYIDHFPIAIGTAVVEGQKLAHIESFDDPHADVSLYEKDLQKVKMGQPVRIKFSDANLPDAMGKIEFIGRDIDPMTKAATIHVPFKAPSNKVIATDMTVTAIIETTNATTWALPESAVLQENNTYFYFTVDKTNHKINTFSKTPCTPTGMSAGYIGIGESVKGKTVVVKGANVLMSESKKHEGGE